MYACGREATLLQWESSRKVSGAGGLLKFKALLWSLSSEQQRESIGVRWPRTSGSSLPPTV